jgi:hypothetical protein
MNDDTLTLYYYNDGLSDRERSEVESALESDALLRQRYDDLCGQLDGLPDIGDVCAPPDATARWHDSIERAARLEHGRQRASRRSFHLPSFALGSAIAATLALGIAIGYYLGGERGGEVPPDHVVQTAVGTQATASSAFTRGLQVHLRQSRLDLASLPADADSDRAILIMHIVQQNRLFERAAKDSDSRDLARVLRAFEPILLRLAADDITPAESAELQAQLAFELNVMLTKLGRNASNESSSI